MKYPEHLEKLMQAFRRLPGVGGKSAERFCFELLRWPEAKLKEFTALIEELPHKLTACAECGALFQGGPCDYCENEERDTSKLCVVATSKELFLIEGTGQFKGIYHVLGGLLSPLAGRNTLNVQSLRSRIQSKGVKELIIAFDGTLEGDASAFYIKEQLEGLSLSISRLAFGMPVGSLLEFAGEGSLAQALAYRRKL